MSGVEVVMLVSGIIGAFASAASYLQERKKKKAEKARERRKEMHKLQKSVDSAPPQIQHEYDMDLARIGPKFAAGDAIARDQLTRILLNMQHQMIAALEQRLRVHSSTIQFDDSTLFEHSERSKRDSISALMQQYQRLCTAAPIPRTFSFANVLPTQAYLMSTAPFHPPSAQSNTTRLAVNVPDSRGNPPPLAHIMPAQSINSPQNNLNSGFAFNMPAQSTPCAQSNTGGFAFNTLPQRSTPSSQNNPSGFAFNMPQQSTPSSQNNTPGFAFNMPSRSTPSAQDSATGVAFSTPAHTTTSTQSNTTRMAANMPAHPVEPAQSYPWPVTNPAAFTNTPNSGQQPHTYSHTSGPALNQLPILTGMSGSTQSPGPSRTSDPTQFFGLSRTSDPMQVFGSSNTCGPTQIPGPSKINRSSQYPTPLGMSGLNHLPMSSGPSRPTQFPRPSGIPGSTQRPSLSRMDGPTQTFPFLQSQPAGGMPASSSTNTQQQSFPFFQSQPLAGMPANSSTHRHHRSHLPTNTNTSGHAPHFPGIHSSTSMRNPTTTPKNPPGEQLANSERILNEIIAYNSPQAWKEHGPHVAEQAPQRIVEVDEDEDEDLRRRGFRPDMDRYAPRGRGWSESQRRQSRASPRDQSWGHQ